MSTAQLIRLGAVAAVVSGALFVVAELLYLVVGLSPSNEALTSGAYVFQAGLFLLAYGLLTGALVGFYAAQSESLGALGSVGFLMSFFGAVLAVGFAWGGVFVLPALAHEAPGLLDNQPASVLVWETVSFGLLALGWVALGVAALRNRVLPRVAALVLIIGAVLGFFPLPFSTIVFGVAVAWTGLTLLSPSGTGAPANRPARVA